MIELPNVEQSYEVELVRKAIHLCSISIPIAYYFITRHTALAILGPLTALVILSDIARLAHPGIGDVYHKYIGWLLRSHERDGRRKRLTGASYVLLSATLCVLFFPKVIVITAFAIMIVSDTFAALIGRKFGKRPFLRKSLEGTSAFLFSALVVVALSPKVAYLPVEYMIGSVAALIGAVVEALSISIDDNLSIPIAIGSAMWLMYLLLLPSVNVFALDLIS